MFWKHKTLAIRTDLSMSKDMRERWGPNVGVAATWVVTGTPQVGDRALFGERSTHRGTSKQHLVADLCLQIGGI
jgi:hypothetical protein